MKEYKVKDLANDLSKLNKKVLAICSDNAASLTEDQYDSIDDLSDDIIEIISNLQYLK